MTIFTRPKRRIYYFAALEEAPRRRRCRPPALSPHLHFAT